MTAKRNEIERLMENVDNFSQVQARAAALTKMFEKYIDAQKKLLSEVRDEDDKLKAIRDFNETIQRVGVFEGRLKAWLIQVEAEIQHEVQPSDSASQLTRVSNLSKKSSRLSQASSRRSSISAARVKETARMAEINAEVKALKQKQALQQKDLKLKEEKMKLSFQMEELNLGTELAKAKAK